MCLYTKHKKPLVATRKIKVYKHAVLIDLQNKTACSPCVGTRFNLNKDFIPASSIVNIADNGSMYRINGGVIHACLWPDFSRGECLEAYIPEGAKYWIGIDHTTVCATKLVVLSKPVKVEDNAGIDPIMAEILYDSAEEHNGVKIGDYLVTNKNGADTYLKPNGVSNVPNEKIRGIVVGFDGSIPEVADIFHITGGVVIDPQRNSILDQHIPDGPKAKEDMDGYKHTTAWAAKCKSIFDAYHVVNARGEDHYIPALGEMKLLIDNILTIAASCSLAGLFCPITMGRYFWTSTEHSLCSSWKCCLGSFGWHKDLDYKDYPRRIVPFVATAEKKKKIEA